MRFPSRAAAAVLFVLALPLRGAGQTAPSPGGVPPIGTVLPADVVRDLPSGDNAYALLETTQPEVIADRFNSGGLNAGSDARLGGFLGSWSQTLFRIGDIDISDPRGSGASLLFPDAALWQRVRVATGLMPIDVNTPGLAVTFEPLRAGEMWSGSVLGTGSGGSLASGAPSGRPVPIARLDNYVHGAALAGGPVSPRTSIVAAATFARGAAYDREQLPSTDSTTGSGLVHLIFTPSAGREWRLLGWVQRSESPFAYWPLYRASSAATTTNATHVQSTYESRATGAAHWRIFAGYTQRDRTNAIGPSTLYIDRIVNGPVQNIVDDVGNSTVKRASAGARMTPHLATGSAHAVEYGADANYASTVESNIFAGTVRESVDGLPARIWSYNAIPGNPRRSSTTVSAFAKDAIALSNRLSLDAGLRAEVVRGGAEGAATSVSWVSVLPHAYLKFAFSERRALTIGYARSANALTHNWLAFGDPAAATARVVSAASPNTLVARVGPGINGNPAFSGIDAGLKRPYTDEIVIGWEKRRSERTRYTLTGIARWEHDMLGVVDTGAPASAYATISIPDAGKDLADPSDDRALAFYNRIPATFGQDAYLVTNPSQKAARAFALRMSLEHSSERLFLLFGATASAAQGAGGNRGYGPLENDQDQPGELFTNPNGASYAYGRLFSDRAFTIKWTTMYRFPGDVTVAGIARYQDGQPFSRLVVVPNLTQGVEAIQAYPNGGSRFTFTGTLDLRVQKGFRVGGRTRVVGILDAYNLFTRNNEVEESVVSGASFRMSTAIEPPPSVHLGLRVTF